MFDARYFNAKNNFNVNECHDAEEWDVSSTHNKHILYIENTSNK